MHLFKRDEWTNVKAVYLELLGDVSQNLSGSCPQLYLRNCT